jgi:hypothetical protein
MDMSPEILDFALTAAGIALLALVIEKIQRA